MRLYVTALDVYKLIVCDPGPVDLSSLVEGFPEGFHYNPGTNQLKSRVVRFLPLLEEGVRGVGRMSLITGFSESVIWTAGPAAHELCNSAYWREQARMSSSFYKHAPYELLTRAYVFWPGRKGFRRVHRSPTLEAEGVPISWKTPVMVDLFKQRVEFAARAVLQEAFEYKRNELPLSDLLRWCPGLFAVEGPRGFMRCDQHLTIPSDGAVSIIPSNWDVYIGAGATGPGAGDPAVQYPLMRLASKIEPAGKVRVFTILDSLSQRLLQPIHDWFCDILRRAPSDL